MAGLAASLTMLYIARAGSALGKTFNATHNSLLADYYPQEARARVFYAHRLANSLGQFVGPLAAGILAAVFTWETPFFVLALPTVVFVFLGLKLREPTRGVHERRAAGADEATAEIEEVPGRVLRDLPHAVRQPVGPPDLPVAPLLHRVVPGPRPAC